MYTPIKPLMLAGAFLLMLSAPALQAANPPTIKKNFRAGLLNESNIAISAPEDFETTVTTLYDQIDLKQFGLTKKAFQYAYKGYIYLVQHHLLRRTDVLSICDFSQSSRNKRFYIIDLDQKTVLMNTYVAHGRNSGSEFARTFSNSSKSHKSSLGFYVTRDTYYGDHGLALKIHGLERGFNDKADRRNIVIHGSHYVGQDFLSGNPFNGRSFGCPAIPFSETEQVIDSIKGGSCLFIYHPTKKYITKSKILNS
jgi:hypothetical protein